MIEDDQQMITEFGEDFLSLVNKHHGKFSQNQTTMQVSGVDFVYTGMCK